MLRTMRAEHEIHHPSTKGSTPLVERLQKLEPRLRKILAITGLPGCSIGVIRKGVEVWKINLGYRDVEKKLPPESDTVFHLNSLTKSVTAAAFACLVQDGKITWETPIRSILPEFAEGSDEMDRDINAIDLLSMRSGHQSLGCLPWQGNNIVLLDKRDIIKFWNSTPRAGSFRSFFSYNNWGYGVITLVFEKLSGQPLHQFFQQRIFDPLGLKRTKMQDSIPFDNSALSYAMLEDRSPVRVPEPTIGAGIFTEGGSGVLSTIDDMLVLYRKYLEAIKDQLQSGKTTTPGNPFVRCTTLVAPHNFLPAKSSILREQSYGCGWIRCQLPGPLGMIGMNNDFGEMSHVLEGGPSHLCLYHMGMMVGSTSNIALIPETDTVVALLANASPLGDGTDWMSQMIIEEIFDPPTRHKFEEYAEKVASKMLNHIPSLGRELEERRVPDTKPSFPLEAYTGLFVHDRTPFKINIRLDKEKGGLTITFMGYEVETYELRHYHYDTFTW